MSVRLSDNARNKLLDGGASGGIKNTFNLGFIAIMSGSQPASANTGASGTLLGTVTVNGDGTTGVGFDAAVAGVISKAAAQTWKFTGLAEGIAGWFRLYAPGDTISATDSTKPRVDGAIGTSGADLNLSNVSIAIGQVNTVDAFTITMPAA
jgi:hypothetical protein